MVHSTVRLMPSAGSLTPDVTQDWGCHAVRSVLGSLRVTEFLVLFSDDLILRKAINSRPIGVVAGGVVHNTMLQTSNHLDLHTLCYSGHSTQHPIHHWAYTGAKSLKAKTRVFKKQKESETLNKSMTVYYTGSDRIHDSINSFSHPFPAYPLSF